MKVMLKDGSSKEYESGISVFDIAKDIACLAIKDTSLEFSFTYTGISNCFPTTCNCFIAAGL